MGTFGSLTTRMFGPALRAAGAQARATLVALAAERLGVPPEKLVVKDGVVSVAGDAARSVTYAQLSRGARITKVVDGKAALRAASQFTVMGRSPPRMDGVEKVTGAARYAGDIRLPGMLYARRAPTHARREVAARGHGASESYPGARVVRDKDLVAVLHAHPEAAAAAFALVRAEWERAGPQPDTESIYAHLVATRTAEKVTIDRGDAAAARTRGGKTVETTYLKGYVAHAPSSRMWRSPTCGTARPPSGLPRRRRSPRATPVARALGFDGKHVRLITPFVGGGFGGKSAGGQAVEAARLSQLAGKPVQVQWTRAEEFFFDTFDPAAVVKIARRSVPTGGSRCGTTSCIAAGERGSALFYDIPNLRTRLVGRVAFGEETERTSVHPFAIGPWRAPGANMNVFAIESQIDIMAAAAKADPVEFRMRHLTDERMRRVLQAAAEAFGWKSAAAPRGGASEWPAASTRAPMSPRWPK